MSAEKIAVTADMDSGLESPVSGHFGHCKAFIVTTVENGEIIEIQTVLNGAHESCAEPINRLADLGVNVLITKGMGMRPFMAAQQVGLAVIRGGDGTVGEVVKKYIEGQSQMMDSDGLCSGGSHHH